MNKAILIIGGGSGIGLACAKKFVSEGHRTVICGRDKNKLEQAAKLINNKLCSFYTLDITSKESLNSLVHYLNNSNITVEALINSAGINVPNRNFENLDDESSSAIIQTNFFGPLLLSKLIIKEMRKSNGGTIIHIGSVAGVRTTKFSGVVYSASKRAINSLVRSINLDEAKNNIRSTVICPASVNTSLILNRSPLPTGEQKKQMLQPETIADITYFIFSQPRNVIIEQIVLMSPSEVDLI